jgi:hypothetical protein
MSFTRTPDGAATNGVVVTPNDGADLPGGPCRGLLLSADANVSVIFVEGDGAAITLPLVKGYNPVKLRRVRATGTGAVNIFALY